MPIDYTTEARITYLRWLQQSVSDDDRWLQRLREYYDGKHEVYLTDRQEQFIGLKKANTSYLYAHNLCKLIVATVVEKLGVTGFSGIDSDAVSALADAASGWWETQRMDALQDNIYEAALRDRAAYVIVDWYNEAPRWTLNLQTDGTSGIRLHSDPDTGDVLFAEKRWITYDPLKRDATGRTRATLYFPNRIEKYIDRRTGEPADRKIDSDIMRLGWRTIEDDGDASWPLWWTSDGTEGGEPLGMAVVPFVNPSGCEFEDIVCLQDMLNKSDLDLIASADAAGFRILWASGVSDNAGSDGDESEVKVAPGHLLKLTDPSARLGAIDPADLSKMIATCKYWIESIAGLSRTPQFLFHPMGADQPSGESLARQEDGLVSKCTRKTRTFGNAWEDVIYLSARLANAYGGGGIPVDQRIQTQWAPLAVLSEAEKLTKAQQQRALGIPWRQVMLELGYTADEVDQLEMARIQEQADKQAEQEAQLAVLDAQQRLNATARGAQEE